MRTVEALFAEAARASQEGRADEAIAAYEAILAQEPDNAPALNALGNRLLSKGDVARARSLLERAAASDPSAAAIWLNLAIAARAAGDPGGELAALDRALQIDPYYVLALLQKGQCLERSGDSENAARTYAALLACLPPDTDLPAPLKAAVDHGRDAVRRHRETLEARIREQVKGLDVHSDRFDYCIDVMVGRKKIYSPQPSGLHFPYLPPVPFFEQAQFPWFGEFEAATPIFLGELLNVVAQDSDFRPYVAIGPGLPVNQWSDLNHSLEWSVFFLWENGIANRPNLERCPQSAAVLERLPLLDIPGRAPTIMFSILKPGARIPPHTGVTNTRAVVHLPLIVPEGCAFRVGAETREWVAGKAWAFDDTIEHEAWNESGEYRAILIVDAWNPYLTQDERALIRAASLGLGERVGREPQSGGAAGDA